MRISISVIDHKGECSITYKDTMNPDTVVEGTGEAPVSDGVLYEALDKVLEALEEK